MENLANKLEDLGLPEASVHTVLKPSVSEADLRGLAVELARMVRRETSALRRSLSHLAVPAGGAPPHLGRSSRDF